MDALNSGLRFVLASGNTILHLKYTYDNVDDHNKPLDNCQLDNCQVDNYQYFEQVLSTFNAGSDVVSTVYFLALKAHFAGLKIFQLSLSLLDSCVIIADPSPRMSKKEKIVRIASNIFQVLRLLFEMRGRVPFYSPYKLEPIDPIWYTLLAFEVSARLFLVDQKRSKKDS